MMQTEMKIIISWEKFRSIYCKCHVDTHCGGVWGHGCQHPEIRRPSTSWGECKPEHCPMKPIAYQLECKNRDCVEVVRCKDCLHWKLPQDSSIHYCIPTHRFSGTNEFCSQGIRKEQTDGNE